MNQARDVGQTRDRRWLPHAGAAASQLISIGVHLLLFVLIGVVWAYRETLTRPPAAKVDVVEFQQEGPPNTPQDSRAKQIESTERKEEKRQVEPHKATPAPQVNVEAPKVDRTIPPPADYDPTAWQKDMDTLEDTINQLRENVTQSKRGSGDGAKDPDSRGQQQGRWTINLEGINRCDEYWRVTNEIGLREFGVRMPNSQIAYVRPLDGGKRQGPLASEGRMCWFSESGGVNKCESAALQEAGLMTPQVIWFMEREMESVLKNLEADYVRSNNKDLDRIRRTVFEPISTGGRWKLRVRSCD